MVIDVQEVAATNESAVAVAAQIGYEGTMTVGALEDEIRFYQRRTVDDCLELGKRLLVLKSLTPHGEFAKRLEMLGFEKTKAQRFMKAAAATAKNSTLQLLGGKTSSFKVFWELVMADDEVVENILEWDDIDRMSGSQARQRVRELEENGVKGKEVLSKQLADAEEQLEARKHELQKMLRGEGLQLQSRHIRAEALANASVMQAACDDMQRLWRAACDEQASSEIDATMRRRAVALAVSGALSHVLALHAAVQEEFDGVMPLLPGALDDFTEDERHAAQASAARLAEQMQDRSQRRRSDAYEEHLLDGGAAKRGRPAGVKTDKTKKAGNK